MAIIFPDLIMISGFLKPCLLFAYLDANAFASCSERASSFDLSAPWNQTTIYGSSTKHYTMFLGPRNLQYSRIGPCSYQITPAEPSDKECIICGFVARRNELSILCTHHCSAITVQEAKLSLRSKCVAFLQTKSLQACGSLRIWISALNEF